MCNVLMIDPSRKNRKVPARSAWKLLEKVLNNTVGEEKMVRYDDASWGQPLI